MYTLNRVDKKNRPTFDFLEDFGSYNNIPRPAKEITEDDYIHKARTYMPAHIEHRQIENDILFGTKKMMSCRIEWFHDCGILILYPSKWTTGGSGIIWQDKVRYFRLGCDHQYLELREQECRKRGITHWHNCWHAYECQKCGRIESVDSSG